MRQMGAGHFWQRVFGIYLYHHGSESFEAAQRLLHEKQITDANGQHAVTIHLSDQRSGEA